MREYRRDFLTIAEVVRLVRRLDGRRGLSVSARQLRYWDTALLLGAGRATDGHNAARVFTAEDVALVRLVRRLQRDEVRDRAVWALLLQHGDALRSACASGASLVLWMEPNGRAHLVTARDAATKPIRECYPLVDVVRGVREAMSAPRRRAAMVWNGRQAVRVTALAAQAVEDATT